MPTEHSPLQPLNKMFWVCIAHIDCCRTWRHNTFWNCTAQNIVLQNLNRQDTMKMHWPFQLLDQADMCKWGEDRKRIDADKTWMYVDRACLMMVTVIEGKGYEWDPLPIFWVVPNSMAFWSDITNSLEWGVSPSCPSILLLTVSFFA